MLVMGACGLAYEYTLSKIASDLLGNSIRQWALIIGFMMFFMGVGADIQKYIKNENLFEKFLIAEVCLGLAGAFAPILLVYTFGVWNSHYVLVQYFFISSIGLLIGFEIPLITRINEIYTEELKFNLGNVLKMDYIGSLAGALLWTFYLPKWFEFHQISFIVGLLNILSAIGAYLFLFHLVNRKKSTGLLIFAAFAAIILGLSYSGRWMRYSEQFLYQDKIVYSNTTPYQHIIVTQAKAGDYSCYINGSLQFNSADEHIYHELLVHPVMSAAHNRESVLILGGGDGLALREILKYPDVKRVDLCDIDPQMTDLAKNNPIFNKLNNNSLSNGKVTVLKNNTLKTLGKDTLFLTSNKFPFPEKPEALAIINLIHIDAACFIEQIDMKYDVIIIDFPDPNTPELAKLYSRKFYTHLSYRLKKRGLFCQQSSSPFDSKEAFLCVGRTINSVGLAAIPYHDNVPSFGEWGFWLGGKKDDYQKKKLIQKISSLPKLKIKTRYLTNELVSASLVFGKEWLRTPNKDINTIFNHKVFDYYLYGWEKIYQ